MRKAVFILATVLLLLGGAGLARGDTFDTSRKTSANPLYVYYGDGEHKQFTAKGTNRSLAGTGLIGTVIDCGHYWALNITGGNLHGRINSNAGVAILLNGCNVVLSNSSSSSNAINGGGGVWIVGPGVLHIDNFAKYSAIYSGNEVTFSLGAVVGVNQMNGSTAIAGYGINMLASSIHVNAVDGSAFQSNKAGFTISGSIVTAISTGDCLKLRKYGSLNVLGSSVNLVSIGGTAIQSGTDIESGADYIAISSSVFCAAGATDGIVFHGKASIGFENVIGAIIGRKSGINNVCSCFIDGGATKLWIASNVACEHKEGEIDPIKILEGDTSGGEAIYMPSSSSTFELDAGLVKLFAPGGTALTVATNIVAGGSLRVESKATYGDFQTLFTASGIIAAAQTVAGSLAFDSDLIFEDLNLAQALASVMAPTSALFGENPTKTVGGLWQQNLFVLGGEVHVSTSKSGITVGKSTGSSAVAYYYQNAGKVEIESDGMALLDYSAYCGYTSWERDYSLIYLGGGRLSAKGKLDGVLTCGGILMEGGTFEAAATGGYQSGTISTNPKLLGYALSANNGFAIDGGSFLKTAGDLRTMPNTSSAHNWASIYPCYLNVSSADPSVPISILDMVPSWYGVGDLYAVNGKLCLWLPAGAASLTLAGIPYVANDNGTVIAGNNEFRISGDYTDPAKADTDGDGLSDGEEVELGTDPTNSDLNIVIVDAYPSLNCGWLYHPLSDGEVSFFIDAYDPDGEELIYAWYVDGREVAGAVGARFACDISGFETGSRHVVECNVTDGLCPRAMSWVIDVTRDLYVDASSPAASPDGRSPGTAFREIPDAVAAAGHGDVIHVAPGTYAPLPPGGGKALRIVSDEGAGTTIVDGRGEGPCVEDGHGYTLVGFTMCNGVSRDGAVIYDCALCNCVVRDCSTQGDCPISYCDLFDCLVVGNAGRASGAGDFYSRFFGCTITGNLATEAGGCGGIDPTCQAYNSIIAGNTCGGSESNYGTAYAEPVMLSCCTSPRLSGTFADEVYGNIYADPRFVDPANGDFRLRPDSPCIDAGDDTVIAFLDDLDLFNSTTCATDGTDVAGHARVMGKGVDIGALEYFAAQAPIDFNGDGRCDIAVYDPKAANWYSEVFGVAQYGWGSTIPTPADYDGDGITDYAAYDQADGAWYILYSADNRYFIPHWGWTGALPVPADYDGDGCADICVFDTKTSTWYIHGTSEGDRVQQFGWSGVVPVPADYDGDGKIDLAIYSPHKKTGNVGAWYILRSSDGATEIYAWGWDGAIPTPADFDGDGKADLAVFNRLDGFWYIHRSSVGGNDCWVPQYGWKTATPVPADYDGDGIADLGIYDLTTGIWYTFGTSEGHRERTFGWRGAVPLNPIYWIHRWFGL